MKKLLIFVILWHSLFSAGFAQDAAGEERSFKIIVNAENSETALGAKDIAKLFLKKVKMWKQTDEPVLLVDQFETTVVRKEFSQEILRKKLAAIKAYWQKQIFSGRGVPPPEKESDEDVLEYVDAIPGAIGYIAISTEIEGYRVTVIEILE